MVCPKCGNQIADGSSVCPYCNQQFVTQVQQVPVQQVQPQVAVQPVQQAPIPQTVQQAPVQQPQVQVQSVVTPVTDTLIQNPVNSQSQISSDAPVMQAAPIPQTGTPVTYQQAEYNKINEASNQELSQPIENIVKQPQDRMIVANGITDMKPQEFVPVAKEEKIEATPEDIVGKKSRIPFGKIFAVLILVIILIVGTLVVLHFSGVVKIKTNVTTGEITQEYVTTKGNNLTTIKTDQSSEAKGEETTTEIIYTTTTTALAGTAYSFGSYVYSIPDTYRILDEGNTKVFDRKDGNLKFTLKSTSNDDFNTVVNDYKNNGTGLLSNLAPAGIDVNTFQSTSNGLRYFTISYEMNEEYRHYFLFEKDSNSQVLVYVESPMYAVDASCAEVSKVIASGKMIFR